MKHVTLLIFFSLCLLWSLAAAEPQNDQWEKANGPYGGVVLSAIMTSDGKLFAGTSGAYVYRSDDQGLTWSIKREGLFNSYVRSLLELDEGDMLIGTYSGIFRSTDKAWFV